MNKKKAREEIENTLFSWNASKMDKKLLLIEFIGKVEDGVL